MSTKPSLLQNSVLEEDEGTRRSLRDVAYDLIKQRITTCAYKPGEYLNEALVSASLGIGRTPVHQAIDRLKVEGLVEVMPRKGIIVKPISLDEVMQIIEVRLLNECYGVRLAATRASQGEIDQLASVLARSKDGMASRDNEMMMTLDREFHGILAQASRNDVLGEQLGRLHDRSLRFWIISLNAPGHLQEVYDEHLAILTAILDRDADAAEQAMRLHIEGFQRNIMGSAATGQPMPTWNEGSAK
ncbi:GntR family transcriptional regulator [Rhizobium sp. P32RR-XVIII]|uniref:GntR family transcriptional regulator n=1 Tax=Rhizobium sp. P32RR-XVIII TaxID=2726738 RepID=UPI001456E538|nr:GntR family transcriptional regulator [Rhizobium sp. P32RR-XVIII]NLS06880.1 GntR family transcriptional regulator [Rhizobium sp. P32RR-XVIII]